jgi:hypothetical protein
MKCQNTQPSTTCPVTVESKRAAVHQAVKDLMDFCETHDGCFLLFEKQLLVLMMALGRSLIELFLIARHVRHDIGADLRDRNYRLGAVYAERDLKTVYGKIRYGRTCLTARRGGAGFYPLDAALGLTRDQLSPWVMQWIGQLTSRMSISSARRVFKSALGWVPANKTVEEAVLGMGRYALSFMFQLPPPEGEGEVLAIEMDGKSPPMATAGELAKRRGSRKGRHKGNCSCGCQRHRGQSKRQSRGSKKRRKKVSVRRSTLPGGRRQRGPRGGSGEITQTGFSALAR